MVFPTRPILSVEAPLIEAQIVETLLLNILNFQTLIATKASRMRQVAEERALVDFDFVEPRGLQATMPAALLLLVVSMRQAM